MNRIALTVIIGLMFALTVSLWSVESANHQNAELQQDLTKLVREKSNLMGALEQARQANRVAQANADRLAAKAAEFDELEEWIKANDDKTPMPDLLRDVFDRVFETGDDH